MLLSRTGAAQRIGRVARGVARNQFGALTRHSGARNLDDWRECSSCSILRRATRHPQTVFHQPTEACVKRWRALCFLSVAVVTTTGCAAGPRPAGPGLRAAHVERLYFGRNIGDSATVSDSAWGSFVHDELTPAFPEGATVWDAAGQWRSPDGVLVRERSFVVELVHLVTADIEARVQRVIDAYKRRFAQEAVLRLVTDAWANF